MLRLFLAELTKIRRSLIFLVIIAIPLMVFGITTLALANIPEQLTWRLIADGILNTWVYFLMPLTVTVVTALLGQVEHRFNTWSYVLSLPQAKWQVFAVKGATAALMMGVIGGLIIVAVLAGGKIGGSLNAVGAPLGSLPIDHLIRVISRVWVCSFLLIAIQYWVAMRVGGIAVPLLFGIGGGIFAIIAGATSFFGLEFLNDDFLPWMLPEKGLSVTASEREIGYLIGGLGGIIAMALASISLARKDWN